MTKRTTRFPRRDKDNYPTPCEALDPAIKRIKKDCLYFAEPCAGEGQLVGAMLAAGFRCVYSGDIRFGRDAFEWKNPQHATIVTNPPWERSILHPMISHFISFRQPVWLLLDADWMHTRQAAHYLSFCTHIVSVGRVKWMPDTKMTGFDNVAWYRFHFDNQRCPIFVPRQI